METYLARTLEALAGFVDFATAVAIAVGVCAAILRLTSAAPGARRESLDVAMPEARLTLGRWLSLALELALAADILRTVMVPTWDEIGKLAAIAALRTILNYFLAREIEQQQKKPEYALPVAA